MPTSCTLMSEREREPFVQDLSHHSCIIAILWRHWRVLPIQAISMVVLSQSMTSRTSAERHLWRISLSSSVMQKGFNLKPHVFVYGQMASTITSWKRLKGSMHTWLAWQKSSINCVVLNQDGFSNGRRKLASSLHNHQQLHHRHQLNRHLRVQLQAFQWKQPQCPKIQACQMFQGMHRFQTLQQQIRGHSTSLGASEADPRWSNEPMACESQTSFAFRLCRRHKALEGGVSCIDISIHEWVSMILCAPAQVEKESA